MEDKLRETLAKRGYDSEQIESAVETVKGFESFLKSGNKNPDDNQALDNTAKPSSRMAKTPGTTCHRWQPTAGFLGRQS